MAINQRVFSANVRGGIATVGNTLGLFGSFNPPTPNQPYPPRDGIGTFITNNTSLQFGSYPPGTTSNWTQNASSNVLTLPAGSKVLSAFLFYGGTSINGVQNVSAATTGPVTFTSSTGIATAITPDNVTTLPGTLGNTEYHARRDVTNLMTGSGTYTLSAVPGTLGRTLSFDGTENNSLGWTIVVAYSDTNVKEVRNITIWDVFQSVLVNSPVDVTVSGFITPPLRTPKGRLFMGASSGDNYIAQDQVFFGPNAGSLVGLSGPNNGLGNFFQSQINNDAGTLSLTGTFGSSNQPYGGSAAIAGVGGTRQGWDKTSVDVSAGLRNNQTSALIRLFTNGDLYLPQYVAMQVELDAPIIQPAKATSKTTARVGEIITYTITFTNVGNANADSITITDPIPNGTSYVVGSITSNVAFTGTPLTTITLTNSLAPGQSVTLSYNVRVTTAIPNPNPIPNTATVNYTFVPALGLNPLPVTVDTNTVYTNIYDSGGRGIHFNA